MSKQLEHAMQKRLVKLAKIQFASLIKRDIFHIQSDQNAEARSPIRGKILKDLGMCAGTPDLQLTGYGARVLWLELKAPDKKRTAKQKEWHDKHIAMGHQVLWTDDEDRAWSIIATFAQECEKVYKIAVNMAKGEAA